MSDYFEIPLEDEAIPHRIKLEDKADPRRFLYAAIAPTFYGLQVGLFMEDPGEEWNGDVLPIAAVHIEYYKGSVNIELLYDGSGDELNRMSLTDGELKKLDTYHKTLEDE